MRCDVVAKACVPHLIFISVHARAQACAVRPHVRLELHCPAASSSGACARLLADARIVCCAIGAEEGKCLAVSRRQSVWRLGAKTV